ncbi:MAG: type IV secretion system protein [Pseudomonadota bacterium]|nr:type IV secretion system protein [Pseudomonadota bacterium]
MTPMVCAAPAIDRFASRLLADTDCQAMGMVERGYAALSQSGGTVSVALTGLMVLAVAFFGYRLLLGRGVLLSDAVGLTIKLGIVLMLATSWASWQALAYDGVARAPTEVASDIIIGIGSPAPILSLENALDDLTAATVGYRSRAGIASPLVGGPAAAGAVLNISAILLTLSTVGILVASRVVLAILLAIAPAMAGFILFDATRGLALGWLGAIVAVAIAPAFALLVAAIEFAILKPLIARLLAEQAAGTFENASVMPIGLVTVVFVIALIFALRSASQIARGLLYARRVEVPVGSSTLTERSTSERTVATPAGVTAPAPRVSRALQTISRRDGAPQVVAGSRATVSLRASSAARDVGTPAAASGRSEATIIPFNRRSPQLRSVPRRSRASSRRDK